jgi:hypothetical protein
VSIALNRSRQVPADETPAFGGIAERFRRAGDLERAVALCRDGLKKFPDHLSARVTLGWALLDLGRYDEAQSELEQVLKRAPDNLAAIRGLAELHERAENAVVVPIDDPEGADVALAFEAANTHAREGEAVSAPAEKAPAAHEPAGKKDKAAHAAAHPVEPPVKAKAEPDARSVFAQTLASSEPEVAHAKTRGAEPPAHEPVLVEPPVVAKAEPAALPSLEELAADFEATPRAFDASPLTPPQVVPDPLVIPEPAKPARKAAAVEPAKRVKEAAAPVEPPKAAKRAVEPAKPHVAPVEKVEHVGRIEPIRNEGPPAVPVAAVAATPEPVLEDLAELVEFLPSSTAEPIVATDDLLLDTALEADAAMLDLAADTTIPDADTLLSEAAALAAPEIEPVPPPVFEPAADLAATHAAMLAEQVSARSEAHPEPDVNELLAQFAQEPEIESAPAAMFTAEPAAFAHPEPDVSTLLADLSHENIEPASTAFATDAFPTADAHPEPQVSERASAINAPAPVETFEHAPLTSSDAPDFLAAMEATMRVEPAAPEVVVEAGPVFELSGEPPAAPIFEAIPEVVLESERLPASIAPTFDFDVPPPAVPPVPPVAAAPVPAPVASAAVATPGGASTPVFAPSAMPPSAMPPPAQPAPAAKSIWPRGKSKSKKTVAALEKMLRRVGSRKLEVASEYRSR